MNKKKIMAMLLSLSICLGAAGCAGNTADNTTDTATDTKGSEILTSINISAAENEKISKAGTSITLGGSSTVSGSGAAVENGTVTITAAGTYSVQGTLEEGQIVVNAGNSDDAYIILSGADISSPDRPAIYVENADKAVIWIAEGTENHLSSSVAADAELDAAVYSKSDLIISGTGSLSVQSANSKGVESKDDLRIQDGSLIVTAAADGIKGKDSVEITGGDITVEAAGDGIVSDNDTDAGKGYILTEGGKISINAGEDGLQGEVNTLIKDTDLTIITGGGSANSREAQQTTEGDSASAKAIKAGLNIVIEGGSINIDSSDDALNSGNNLVISAGTINISSGDDGLHADSSLTMNSGTLNMTKAYEGIESQTVTVNGGKIDMTTSDDGFNVAGGNDSSATSGSSGQDGFDSSDSGILTINGGEINVDCSGDGLDSNGSIKLTAGTVTVNGPTNDGNGAIDYNGSFDITGGVLIAAGSSGMAEAPSTSSTQNSVKITLTSQSAGTAISIKDSSGKEIASFTPSKQYAALVVSSPDIKSGSTYKGYAGGNEIGSFTVSGTVSEVTQSGASSGTKGGQKRP